MRVLPLAIVFASVSAFSQDCPASGFQAGTAKVDVTPAASELPKTYEGILDHLFARAIVIANATTKAALVTLDAGAIPDPLWLNVTNRAEAELGIPAKHILITATHSHSVPRGSAGIEEEVFESLKLANERLKPARIAFGTGVSYLNVNRNRIDPGTRKWAEGPNYDGPSDKTVAVVKFESLNRDPIAVCYNYAMHPVTVGQPDQVSADAPGAASRYIEDSYDGGIVAAWSSGAAGDQNPIYFQQTNDLRELRIKDYAKRGEDISNSMPPGGQGLNRGDPVVAKLMAQQKQMILSLGQFLGEEVMHVMRGMERKQTGARIAGMQKVISCPGRQRTDTGRAGSPGSYKDAEAVELRLSLLVIGDIAFGAVNGEVFNLIGQRFKRESPFAHTMMVTLTNGMARSGYIPNDAAFGYHTFEVLSSRLKPGCAESGIVNGLLDLMGVLGASNE